jgi:uncharacterized protein with ATP-grasp and redox domains
MRTYLECVPCFVRQALDASRMVTDDPVVHEQVLRETLRLAVEMPFDRSPPWMGQQIHRLLREATHNCDPYAEVKRRSNALALALYPALQDHVRGSVKPFATAVALAIAGNVIDFGCRTQVDNDEVRQAINEAMNVPLSEAAIADLHQAVEGARDILYLADNAGEIVFDRLLIEQMPKDCVTLVVRGSPVINDATREDAEAVGLSSLVAVMDNGSDAPGTILESCSPAFRSRFEQCDLVVAKGQGNYETLDGQDRSIVFLFKAKCPVIARDVGAKVGQMVICQHCRQSKSGSGEPAVRLERTGVLK